MSDTGSTLPRRQLGRYLIDWRTRAGMSQQRAAELLEIGSSSLQRLERGLNGRVQVREIQAACDLYGISDAESEIVIALARQANVKTWWYKAADRVPIHFDGYVKLEAAAVELRTYQPELIPGLLQTPDYIRGLFTGRPEDDAAEYDRWVQIKKQRQNNVTRKHRPTDLFAIVSEAALRRVSGSPQVMAAQLRHLADMSTRPNINLQVLPFSAGFPRGVSSGPFMILNFGITATGVPVEPTVVYVEGSTVDMYLEEPIDVQRYHDLYTAIEHAALDSVASRDLIRKTAREHAA
ncbi:helix-turn-helix domain-containing protein [Nocardia colli]|uniref:Helix-turn-helix domain-containing protein n=1 Tax=Nocardia colli TaxID=2545717 RepID=A0A5N0EF53_9NOCA|nr:helix-turn-helix transcriptional regulator [Nocardia colli]KAA8887553.1 helix-turn-helix domain-containing protein [Nocardia colli]